MSNISFFPHDTIRLGQKALLEDVETAITSGKILLANAPTGVGKTASSLAIAVKFAIEHNKIVFFLTNRHTQHRIAIDTLQLLRKRTGHEIPCVDLIGKRWMCNQEISTLFGSDFNEFCKSIVEKGECEFYNNVWQKRELTVVAKAAVSKVLQQGPLHNEDIIRFSQGERLCSYELSLALAKKAKVVVGDYNYLFNPFVQSTFLNKINKELADVILVVDEGHNLPSRVTDMLSSKLSNFMVTSAISEAKKFHYEGLLTWLESLLKTLENLGDATQREELITKSAFTKKIECLVDPTIFVEELETAADEVRKKQRKSFLGGIAAFLDQWPGDDQGYARILSRSEGKFGKVVTLQYTCLDPGMITKDIFSSIHSGIVMSGTLQPTFMYKDTLGIDKAIEKNYPSPFPPENKLSLIIPETSTKYTMRSTSMYQNIAKKCSNIANAIPGNVALFFPSYALRDHICNFIQTKKKLFWEKSNMSKEEKEIFFDEFKLAKEQGGILLGVAGANFAEGVDFPGDILKGVVVVGLPLGKPDLKTKEIIKYYDQQFNRGWDYGYTYPAMSKCIQSAGRCIRSETDKGVVVFLDERFAWQRYYDCFPDKIGLRVSKEYLEPITAFFHED